MQLIFKVNYTHENERNDTYVGVFRVVVVTPCDHQRPPKWIIWKDEAPVEKPFRRQKKTAVF